MIYEFRKKLKEEVHEDEETGRFFIVENDLDELAAEYDCIVLESKQDEEDTGNYDILAVESACCCRVISEFDGYNPNAHFSEVEIVFKDLYLIVSGVWEHTPWVRPFIEDYQNFLDCVYDVEDGDKRSDIDSFVGDTTIYSYDILLNIAEENPPRKGNLSSYEALVCEGGSRIAGLIWLTDDERDVLDEYYYIHDADDLDDFTEKFQYC